MSKKKKKYHAWKTDKDFNPMVGFDRIYTGLSERAILNHIAYEEGLEYQHNRRLVRLDDGTMWFVTK